MDITARELELFKLISYDGKYLGKTRLYGYGHDAGQKWEPDFGPEPEGVSVILRNYIKALEFVKSYFPTYDKEQGFVFPNIIFSRQRKTRFYLYMETDDPETISSMPVEELVLGEYYASNNRIILFMDNIRESAHDFSFAETCMNTFVHELFHAYHYWCIHYQGYTWDGKSPEKSEAVKEGLARAVEYQWSLQYFHGDEANHPMRTYLEYNRYSNTPYKYALVLMDSKDDVRFILDKYFSNWTQNAKAWGPAFKEIKRRYDYYLRK